jgi:hypothetical protein
MSEVPLYQPRRSLCASTSCLCLILGDGRLFSYTLLLDIWASTLTPLPFPEPERSTVVLSGPETVLNLAGEVSPHLRVQRYLAHKKKPTPQDHHRTLG